MLEGDSDSSNEYCEETDTYHPLADLLEQFQRLKNHFASLKSNTPQSKPVEELSQLIDKLQHLTMMLQPAPSPVRNQCARSCRHTQTLCATQRESNLTTTILQDIPTFDGQDSSKLEDWFMDIETVANKSHTYLAKAKSHNLTHTLISEATQTGKCCVEIKGTLKLKLYNANIHTYTSRFMEIQQRDNETLAAYINHFKTAARWCAFDNDTVAIHIFVKGLRDAPTIPSKIYGKDPPNTG